MVCFCSVLPKLPLHQRPSGSPRTEPFFDLTKNDRERSSNLRTSVLPASPFPFLSSASHFPLLGMENFPRVPRVLPLLPLQPSNFCCLTVLAVDYFSPDAHLPLPFLCPYVSIALVEYLATYPSSGPPVPVLGQPHKVFSMFGWNLLCISLCIASFPGTGHH